MFAGRRAQAYCLSPVPTGGKLLVHTPLPQQEEPKASSQLMASPAPNDERWRVFVSSCANTGVLILANSTTTVSHLQGVTYRFRCFLWLMLSRSGSASITSLAVFPFCCVQSLLYPEVVFVHMQLRQFGDTRYNIPSTM